MSGRCLLLLLLLPVLLAGCPRFGAECASGTTVCGDTCVDLATTQEHCGACGSACGEGLACREGVCADARLTCEGGPCRYDVVAACFNLGTVVGLNARTLEVGATRAVGDGPQALARMQDALLVLDGLDQSLRAVRLDTFAPLGERVRTGSASNHLLVEDPYVYVVSSTQSLLQVFERTAPGSAGTGLGLVLRGSVDLGAGTNPWAVARLGDSLYVTLYGNLVEGAAEAGGKVARVSVVDPLHPRVVATYALPRGDALQPFAGRHPEPTPTGVLAHGDHLDVTLNSLDPSDYGVGGPALLAELRPDTGEVVLHALGDGCLSPTWLAPLGERLLVSCGGRAEYDGPVLAAVTATGVVLTGADHRPLATHVLACPSGDTSCALGSAGRITALGTRAFVTDNNAGRVFVLDVEGDQLQERRGLGGAGTPALVACPPRFEGSGLVGDVVALP